MQRYFILNEQIDGPNIKMNKDDAFHIHKVMRMQKDDQIICVDENEKVYLCKIVDEMNVQIVNVLEQNNELDVRVRLIYGFPKADKFEWVLQKCTELGVSEIVPFLSNRSLIKMDEQRFEKKRNRFEKIIKEACEQSCRNRKVILHKPCKLKDLKQFLADYKLVAYEEEAKQGGNFNFPEVLNKLKANDVINIVVGPEGGFDKEEVDALLDMGYLACSLGKRILRSETAPIEMMSVIAFYRELI